MIPEARHISITNSHSCSYIKMKLDTLVFVHLPLRPQERLCHWCVGLHWV